MSSLKPENILPEAGEVFLYPGFFNATESRHYMAQLLQDVPWKQEPITIFGKTVLQPRLTAWYGDEGTTYSYSGITMPSRKWLPVLEEIKARIEAVSGVCFTGVLLNLYRDGQDSMGWHRDNEKELGINPVIGSVSFGAERVFQFRRYAQKDAKISLTLTNGSFLLMQGATQHNWEHCLPKRAGVAGMRMNLTFRVVQ